MDVVEDRDELRARLVGAVDAVEPVLRAHADEAPELGTLPEPAWRALHDAGLFRLKAPRELGGDDADPLTQILVFERVAAIDTSAGWTLFVGAGNLAMLSGFLPDAGIADVLVEGRLPRVASGIMPSGTARRVEDGYRLSGRWAFGSGCRHAEWFTGNAVIEDPGDGPPVLGFAFPAAAVEIHDGTWDVAALRGTGSLDFSVTEIVVPAHRSFDGLGPPARGGPIFGIPLPGFVAMEHGAFALGVARRAIEEVTELAKTKTRGYVEPQGVAARPVFQHDLGRCDLALRAARAGLIAAYDDVYTRVVAGEQCGVDDQTLLRCAAVYATEVAIDVCRRLFRYAGARSLHVGNVIERCLRDVTAAGQHAMVNEAAYEGRGQVLLDRGDARAFS